VIGQLAAQAPRSSAADRELLAKRSEEMLHTALDTFDTHQRKGRTMGPEGVAWRQRAIAENARVHWLAGVEVPAEDELVGHWVEAVAAFEAMGHVFEIARSQARLAAVLSTAGRSAEARPYVDAARATATDLGAQPLIRELRLATSGGARQHEPSAARTDLTPREHQILALVAEGRSNGDRSPARRQRPAREAADHCAAP
jgi:hypothetical protein